MSRIPDNTTSSYLPIPWAITSVSPSTHACPSPSSLLGTFAIVNGIVSLLALLFGHRRVIEELSCGYLGKQHSSAWKIMWLVPVGLQLAANACIALLISRADGYAATFEVSELMTFLTARPRLSWIVLGFVASRTEVARVYPHRRGSGGSVGVKGSRAALVGKNGSRISVATSYEGLRDGSYTSSPDLDYSQSQRGLDNPYSHVPNDLESEEAAFLDYPWWSAFMTQFVAEFVLQSMALYIMGRTAHYGTVRNYYKIYLSSYWKMPAAARMMYSGALYYLVAGSIFLLFASFFILWQLFSSKKVFEAKQGRTMTALGILIFLLISTWMGSWLFWAGFVKLAGDAYCPPKLIQQGVIWTIFSTAGIIMGTGL